MKSPFQPQSSNEIVYHYTSVDAFMSILGKDYITLRATACLYLNDSSEIIEGINSIKRVDKKHDISKQSFRNYYLTSFSKVENKLDMWRSYANDGRGVVIGLNLESVRKCYGSSARCIYGREKIDSTLSSFLSIYRLGGGVHYAPDGTSSIIKSSETQINSMVNNQYIATCISAKNDAYESEEEVRCFCHNNDGKQVKFINRSGVITPYVEVKIPKDAIKEIVIGPRNKDNETVVNSVLHFLEINKYQGVKVGVSDLPYRG